MMLRKFKRRNKFEFHRQREMSRAEEKKKLCKNCITTETIKANNSNIMNLKKNKNDKKRLMKGKHYTGKTNVCMLQYDV